MSGGREEVTVAGQEGRLLEEEGGGCQGCQGRGKIRSQAGLEVWLATAKYHSYTIVILFDQRI